MNSAFRPPFSVLRSLSAIVLLLASGAAAPAQVATHAVRQPIGGIDVVALKTGVQDVVTLRGTLAAGDSLSPDSNPEIADLTGGMLDKGTTAHDKFALAQLLGNVGASISFNTGPSTLNLDAKCLRKDLPLVIGLIAEQLRSPAFSAEEFEKLKKQFIGETTRALENTDFRAGDALSRAIYPLGHPNRQTPVSELLAGANRATLDDVKAFHIKYYGPATMHLVLVGDVDVAAAQAEIARAFAGWTGGEVPPHPAKAGSVDAARDQTIFMRDKTSVSVLWGQATGLRYNEPDALALRVATSALGGGFSARLMSTVRNQEGLTYNIGSYVSGDTFVDGDWRLEAAFAPELMEKGIESTKRQLTAWYRDGITDAELAQRKTDMAGAYKLGLSTTGGMAGAILNALNRDLGLAFIDEYPARIAALTKDQVNAAIKKHLDTEKMVLVKAGTVTGAK
jgi:zinc protease